MVSREYIRTLRVQAAENFYEWFDEFYRKNESKFVDAMEKAASVGISEAICWLKYHEDDEGFKNSFMIEKETKRIEILLSSRLDSQVKIRILYNRRVRLLPGEKRRFEYKVFIDFGTERKLKC